MRELRREINRPLITGSALIPLFGWLILTQAPFLVIALALGILTFILVSQKPEWGLYLMVLSIPLQEKISVSFGSQRLTVTQAVVLLSTAAWFANRAAKKSPLVRQPTPPLLPFFLLYIFAQLISLQVANNFSDSLAEISRWIITLLAYILTTSLIETRRQFWTLVVCLTGGQVAEGILGVVQNKLNLGPASAALGTDFGRSFGTFEFPNPYAGYLELGLPILVALTFLAWKERGEAMRRWLGRGLKSGPFGQERKQLRNSSLKLALLSLSAGWVSWGIIASDSRGAWAGLIVAAFALIAVRGRKSGFLWLAIFLTAGFGWLAFQAGALSPDQVKRLSSITQFAPFDVRGIIPNDENFAVVERMAMWQAGGNMFLSSPWLGVGIGNFTAVYKNFNEPFWNYSRGHAHNYYINAAAETGVVGLVAYLALILTGYGKALLIFWRTKDRALRYVAWGGIGALTALIVHNIVENLHVLNLGIEWSAILALFYLIPLIEKEPVREGLS